MKKIIVLALAVLSMVTVLTACGNFTCAMCAEKCSDKHTYANGEVIICDKCYDMCTEHTTEESVEAKFQNLGK